MENYVEPDGVSIVSSTPGMGYDTACDCIVNTKSCGTILFVTNTIGDTQRLCDGEMIPLSSMSCNKVCTVS